MKGGIEPTKKQQRMPALYDLLSSLKYINASFSCLGQLMLEQLDSNVTLAHSYVPEVSEGEGLDEPSCLHAGAMPCHRHI